MTQTQEMQDTRTLLAEYATTQSETAFREVVSRYLNLVYSTAIRLVNGDSHLAEDVAQRVFADLARMAGGLSKDVMLGGWLHRHTCYLAMKTMRAERRRQAREEQAVQMNEMEDCSTANFAAIAPVLDEAINNLGAEERQAIVLRYFEERDFRSVGEALGSSEEAARKRVTRALEKLRGLLSRRGVALSAAGLGAVLEAHAVAAAPAGIALGVTTAALATVSTGGGTALTTLYLMSMTKFQGGVIAVITMALSIPLVMQYQAKEKLRHENEALRAEAAQVETLKAENARLTKLVAPPTNRLSNNNDQLRELMKLRGEVGVLKKTANQAEAVVNAGKQSPLSGITANPEMSKVIRDQQKMGLSAIYKTFGKNANLPAEKQEAFNDLLADEVMIGIDHITAGLRDGKTPQEMDQIFTQHEAATDAKVKALVGDEAFTQYQEYNRNLVSSITAEQFKAMSLKGEKEAKDAKTKQLYELLEQEKQRTLAAAGLPADYQLVPTLNFRNFASDDFSERNLKLLDSVYEQVQNQAHGFLSPEEVEKFGEFRKMAVNNNRLALSVNRKLMAPAAPAQ